MRGFLEACAVDSVDIEPISDDEIQGWLRGYVKSYPLFLFLDYDGTLTPLVDHPAKARLSRSMRAALRSCA